MDDITVADFPSGCQNLIKAIGLEAMVKACQACGGMQMYLPMIKCVLQTARRRQIRDAYAMGETVETIAENFGTSPRYIKAVIAGLQGFSTVECR